MKRREFLTSSAVLAATPFIGGTVAVANPVAAIFGALFTGAMEEGATILGKKLVEELFAKWTGPEAPRPPSNFQPPPYPMISLWLSELTAQIYEIRQVSHFFAISSLNPLIPPIGGGGGIVQPPFLYDVQAFGPPMGPFGAGQLLVRRGPNGPPRIQGTLLVRRGPDGPPGLQGTTDFKTGHPFYYNPVDSSQIGPMGFSIDFVRLR